MIKQAVFYFSTPKCKVHAIYYYYLDTVGPQTERILGQEKTRSAQNCSDWGQTYVVKCENKKNRSF